MDKTGQIELQKIDCNCNDCIFMVRDIDKFKEALERHKKWQIDHFESVKQNFLDKAQEWKTFAKNAEKNGDLDRVEVCNRKAQNLTNEANKMRFQFDRSTCSINYGRCSKFDKDVTFIPNLLQLHTQECFKHRRENQENL